MHKDSHSNFSCTAGGLCLSEQDSRYSRSTTMEAEPYDALKDGISVSNYAVSNKGAFAFGHKASSMREC